jgi:NAD(P)-dependent dehydrogenase (short-subunit alcohol dehydrogenase family)
MKQTAIVTGASSGIGLALAQALSQAGFNVVATSRQITKSQSATADYALVDGDIADSQTAERVRNAALERFGRIDLLVNNAGIFVPKPFHEYTSTDFERVVGTNIAGFFHMTQRVLPQMMQQQSGHILNISTSLAAQPIRGVNTGLSSLTKGGLDAVTRELAIEYSPQNIRVNTIAPGIVDTPMHKVEDHEFLRNLHPLPRLATVSEMVEAAFYLHNATFVTGHILYLDGGAQAGKW